MQEDNGADKILDVNHKRDLQENKRVVEYFRRCFATHEGQIVLNQLLIDLKYYAECNTETDVALNNYAKFMIKERLQIDNTSKITQAIFNTKETALR